MSARISAVSCQQPIIYSTLDQFFVFIASDIALYNSFLNSSFPFLVSIFTQGKSSSSGLMLPEINNKLDSLNAEYSIFLSKLSSETTALSGGISDRLVYIFFCYLFLHTFSLVPKRVYENSPACLVIRRFQIAALLH